MIVLNTTNIVLLLTVVNNFMSIIANKFNIKDSKDDMRKALAAIVKSCQINDYSSIFVAANFNHNDIQLLSDIRPKLMKNSLDLPMQIIENTIESVIIFTDSADDLTTFFMQITHSYVWDRLKYTIILNESTRDNNCDEHARYLYIALKQDIINTIFLCMTSSKQIMLYTFNPYTVWAPALWKINKQQWNYTESGYIYTTQYKPNTFTCEDLFFDKTRRIDGYNGLRAVTHVPLNFEKHGISYDQNTSAKKVFDTAIIESVFSHMGLTDLSYITNNNYGTFDELGNPCGVDKDVSLNKFDILVDTRFLSFTKNSVQSSQILGQTGVTFVSHYRPNVSTVRRIINYFRPIIVFFSIIILVITIAILKISKNESFSVAVMEVFRLFFNGPLLRVPSRQSPRIYIFTILVFILVMQSIFRSKILSFIMAPETNDLETFKDLADHKEYTIYCKPGFEYVLPPEIKRRCTPMIIYTSIVNESNAVLIWDEHSNMGLAYKYKLHPSKEVSAQNHVIYRMRRTWPLSKRVNKLLERLFESGISDHTLKYAVRTIQRRESHFNRNKMSDNRTLNLTDLKFVFQILVFGVILGFFIFSIEIKCWEYIRQYFNRILRALKCEGKHYYTNES